MTARGRSGRPEVKPDRRPVFRFDASACSGCKACQAACKDRNGLPVGVLWRRVYEVAGGGWTRAGAAWTSDVFAYFLSVGCNHCEEPICAEVCPAGAYTRRPDGIVLLDGSRCLGCRYCAWACPYGAPQFDEALGRMGKCGFCAEDLDRGDPPACVAACPMRALDWSTEAAAERNTDAEAKGGPGVPYPLPAPGLTRPSLIVVPHRDNHRAGPGTAQIGNTEEVGSP